MKKLLLNLFIISSVSFSSTGPISCFKAAKQDSILIKHLTIKQMVSLCAGADSLAPINCFKEALEDKGVSKELYLHEMQELCSK